MKSTITLLIFIALTIQLHGQISVTVPLPSPCESISFQEEPEKRHDLDVKIYPNPGQGSFTLDVNASNPLESILVDVYSIAAVRLYSEKIYCQSTSCIKQFAGLNLSDGIYHVVVTAGSIRETRKLIVQR